MVSSVVASEMLEVEVLFFEERSSVRSKSDKAIGSLDCRRVGSTAESEATSSDLQVWLTDGKRKEEDYEYHRFG